MKLFTTLFLLLTVLNFSCVGPPVPSPREFPSPVESDLQRNEAADTDCSYFYFLWARTSEAKGLFDEALEAYEKAVVCDENAEFVVQHLATLLLRMNRKKQALAWVEKLIAARPNEAKIQIFHGDLYSAIGEFGKAIEIYKSILKKDPENETVLFKLGKQYLNELDYSQARIIFEQLVNSNPESFAGHYYLAKLYRQLKFYRKAFAAYDKALELKWSVPLAMENAAFYEEQELYDDAITTYRKMLKEEDYKEAAGGSLVRIYLRMKEPEKALEVLQELRKSTLDVQRIDFTIGRIYMEKHDYDKSIELFSEMLKQDPELDVARSLLALAYYEKGDLDKAKELLLMVEKDDRGYDEALYMLVKIYADEEDLDSAVNLIEKVLSEAQGDKINYYSILASLHEEAKKIKEAEKVLKDMLELYSDSTDVHFKYGMFLERHGRLDEAMEIMKHVLTLNPNEPYALNYVGYSWADRGVNLEEALDYIKQAIIIRPDDGFIRDSLGWVYFKLGDFKQASVELLQALSAEPGDPTIHEHLGDVYQALKKNDDALSHFKQSLKLLEAENGKEEAIKRIKQKIDSFK